MKKQHYALKTLTLFIFLAVNTSAQIDLTKQSFQLGYSKFIQPVEDPESNTGIRMDSSKCGMIAYVDYVNNVIYVRDTINKRMLTFNNIKSQKVQHQGYYFIFEVEEEQHKLNATIHIDLIGGMFIYITDEPETSFRLSGRIKLK